MSSTNSRDYYHSSSRRQPQAGDGLSLPPLRSVLGDQLDLPVSPRGYQSPYDLGDISRALPPSSKDSSFNQHSHRSTTIERAHTSSRHGYEHSHEQRQSTVPRSSLPGHFDTQSRHKATFHDDCNHESRSSSFGTSPPSRSKRYPCTWEGCDKRFERQYALDTHMNIHLEQKPFACPVPTCGRLFNVLSNMRRHLQTHNDEIARGDDAEGDEGRSGYFHHSGPDVFQDAHRRSSEHHVAIPAQSYYSSERRA